MTLKESVRKKVRGVRRHGHTTHRGTDDHPLYSTVDELTAISGSLQTDIDANAAAIVVLDTKVDTTSGTLQDAIDAKPDTLLELTDTPAAYDNEKYLRHYDDIIITKLRERFGENVVYKINKMENIKREGSGKFRFVISNLDTSNFYRSSD